MDKTDALKKLWQEVFHDDAQVIDAFFEAFPMERMSVSEYIGGRLAAAAFILPFGELVSGGVRTPCAHIYAVMVHPDFRKRGLGVKITNMAAEKAQALGFSAVVLHPANIGLFDFYKRHCGFNTAFTAKKRELAFSFHAPALNEATISEYITARRDLLVNIPHIDLSENILKLFKALGGRLYVFPGGCAAVEDSEGFSCFREVLGDRVPEHTLSAMTDKKKALCLSPSPDGEPFGMIKSGTFPGNCWMGLALE